MGIQGVLRIAAAVFCSVGLAAAQTGDRGVRLPEPIAVKRKMALVIGNQAYAQIPLTNPVHDAVALAAELRSLGFDSVTEKRDLTNRQLRAAVDEFAASVKPGDLALCYYAGHGIQANELNYLIPVDFAGSEADLPYDAYPASQLRDKLEQSGARLRILILDACRNNPFRGRRGGAQGLSAMGSQVEGTYIAYATADDGVADDNTRENNGLFTRELLRALATPELEMKEIFERVKESVYQASKGAQRPFTYDGVVGRYYFRPRAADAGTPKNAAQAQQKLQQAWGAGLAALKDKRYPEAIGLLLEASRIDPQQHVVWATLGSAYAEAREYASAEMGYRKAIAIQPNEAAYHTNLGLALAQEGQIGEAEREIGEGARLDPASAGRTHYNVGAILTNLGMPEAGAEEFRRAMQAEPPIAAAAYQYGLYLVSKATVQAGRFAAPDGAKQAFERYLSLATPAEGEERPRVARELAASIGSAMETLWKRSAATIPQAVPPRALKAKSVTPPVYPALAKAVRVQGAVRLRATVDPSGTVQVLELVSGNPLLVKAALENARNWTFEMPGSPMWARAEVEVHFQLEQ